MIWLDYMNDETWNSFVDFVEQKRPALSAVLRNVRAVSHDGKLALLAANGSYPHEIIKDEQNQDILQSLLVEFFGQKISFVVWAIT